MAANEAGDSGAAGRAAGQVAARVVGAGPLPANRRGRVQVGGVAVAIGGEGTTGEAVEVIVGEGLRVAGGSHGIPGGLAGRLVRGDLRPFGFCAASYN
jgi:hypothetical protein